MYDWCFVPVQQLAVTQYDISAQKTKFFNLSGRFVSIC